MWHGGTCFIVGSGPSLRGVDLDVLRGRCVIALKQMWWRVPFANVMFFADDSFVANLTAPSVPWPVARGRPPGFDGLIVTAAEAAPPPCLVMRKAGREGLAQERDALHVARTSAHPAANLAAHAGVSRIIWLGIDAAPGPDGATHCHAGHKLLPTAHAKTLRDLATIAAPLADLGIEVLNATPGGALDIWPRIPLADALAKF